jgi:tricorn protease
VAQLFIDTFRFERDFFYDPGMHGVNWNAMKERYMTLLDDAVTRWDVNWIIGEFLGELNASHTYHGGGDLETGPDRSIGMLGVDWELANGAYRIKTHRPRRTVGHRRPLAARRAGRQRQGGRLRARGQRRPLDTKPIRGRASRTRQEDGRADGDSSPSHAGARQVVVTCLDDEIELRFRAWIEERRQMVDKATGGKVGYIYVQSTGTDAQNELMRSSWRSGRRTA